MEATKRAITESDGAELSALLDICDMLAEFQRELRQLRARQTCKNEMPSESIEERNSAMVIATKAARNRELNSDTSRQQKGLGRMR